MAFIDITIASEYLNMYTPVAIIIPDEKLDAEVPEGYKYPVVYCLHGYKDNYLSWMKKSMLEQVAREYKCAVVTPNCPNSFYTDGKNGFDYYDYVIKELPVKLSRLLPISTKREDSFIMGVSMGGYGAFMLAMNNPDKYRAAYAFSGPLGLDYENGVIFGINETMSRQVMGDFGTEEEFHNSRYYLYNAVNKLNEYQGDKPRLKAICGLQDPLCLTYSNKFVDYVKNNTSLSLEYETADGKHDFFFWNKYLDDAFHFFGF